MLNLLVANTNYVFALYKLNVIGTNLSSVPMQMTILGKENLLNIDDSRIPDSLLLNISANENDEKIKLT
jgi:hypothetical protein